MHNSHDTPTDTAIAEQEHTDEERVRELVQQTRELLAEDDSDSAIALFSELHPADQADVLAGLARERQDALLKALPSADTADILEHLDLEMAVQVSEGINAQGLADILDASSPDVAADILKHLPRAQSQATLQVMREAEAVAPLLRYPDDRAGGLMTPDYPAISGDMTATDALDLLRHLGPEAEDLISVFVVDGRGRLEGSLSLARLALAQPTTRVRDIMDTEVISVSADTDQEECARILEHYGLSSLPVLDQAGRFIGVIWSEDVFEVLEEEATEDMYRLAGMGAETVFGPFQSSVRSRLPWLSVIRRHRHYALYR